MATDDDIAKIAAQLASVEMHAKAVLSWAAEIRKTIATLTADIAAQRPAGGYNGGY